MSIEGSKKTQVLSRRELVVGAAASAVGLPDESIAADISKESQEEIAKWRSLMRIFVEAARNESRELSQMVVTLQVDGVVRKIFHDTPRFGTAADAQPQTFEYQTELFEMIRKEAEKISGAVTIVITILPSHTHPRQGVIQKREGIRGNGLVSLPPSYNDIYDVTRSELNEYFKSWGNRVAFRLENMIFDPIGAWYVRLFESDEEKKLFFAQNGMTLDDVPQSQTPDDFFNASRAWTRFVNGYRGDPNALRSTAEYRRLLAVFAAENAALRLVPYAELVKEEPGHGAMGK